MADKKVTALTDIGTGILSTDVWMVIADPPGTPVNKKMTVSNFTGYLPSFIGFAQAPQALTAATGAVSVTTAITTMATAALSAYTLANGTVGQTKYIVLIVDGGNAVITVATPGMPGTDTTLTFDTVGDACTLLFLDTTSGWTVVGNNGVVVA